MQAPDSHITTGVSAPASTTASPASVFADMEISIAKPRGSLSTDSKNKTRRLLITKIRQLCDERDVDTLVYANISIAIEAALDLAELVKAPETQRNLFIANTLVEMYPQTFKRQKVIQVLRTLRVAAVGGIDTLANKRKPKPETSIDKDSEDESNIVLDAIRFAQTQAKGVLSSGAAVRIKKQTMQAALEKVLGKDSKRFKGAMELVNTGFVEEVLNVAKGRSPITKRMKELMAQGISQGLDFTVKSKCFGLCS